MSLSRPISVIVFDRKANDYADLPARLGWRHYCIYNLFRLGLDADGIPTDVWINLLATIFCARAGLKAAWVTFANVLRWLVTALNPDASGFLLWPDLQLILDVLKAAPDTLFSSKRDYTASLLQQLEGITRASGELFRAFRGFQAERDIIAPGQSVVISMPNMFPSWARQFFVDIILAQILYSRMHRSHRVDSTEVLVVIEEADPDISSEAEQMFPDRMCPISEAFKKGREFGISVCVSISSLRSASRLVLSNATDHFMFRMTDSQSVYEAGRTLMLPPKGELRLNSVQPGECLVRQIGPWPHATVAKVDYMPPCRQRPQEYDTHPYVPSKRLRELPHVQEALAQKIAESRKPALIRTHGRTVTPQLTSNERALLGHMTLHEYEPVRLLFRRMGEISPSTQKKILNRLARAGLIETAQTRAGKSVLRLAYPTKDGWEYVKARSKFRPLRGGLVHTHVCRWKQALDIKRGCDESRCEFPYPNGHGSSDVGTRIGDTLYFTEVVIECTKNLRQHARDCFADTALNVQTLTIVTLLKSQQDKLHRQLISDPELVRFADRIVFVTVDQILKELWP